MPKEVGVRVFDVMHEILIKDVRLTPDRSTEAGERQSGRTNIRIAR